MNISKFFLVFLTNVMGTTRATSIFYNNITNCAVLIAKHIYLMDMRYIRYVWMEEKRLFGCRKRARLSENSEFEIIEEKVFY